MLAICTLATLGSRAAAGSSVALDGSWVGSRNGVDVTWNLTEDGRLRIDGRGADYVIHGDTLAVQFDPVDGATTPGETAVYRFAAEDGATRLFVYGFDLGMQGILLTRTRRPEVAEETTPPVPVPAQSTRPPVPGRR